MQIDPKRFTKREEAIKMWLRKNNQDRLLTKLNGLLNDLPKEEITAKFKLNIEAALIFCRDNKGIRGLDFMWDNHGKNGVCPAYAYGKEHSGNHQILSDTYLAPQGIYFGPKDIPWIETEENYGIDVELEFSIPTDVAINVYMKNILPEITEIAMELNYDVRWTVVESFTDIVQIWNYKIGYDVCNNLIYKNIIKGFENRIPFWITLHAFDRGPVPILVLSKL
ncbi:hypothetical protein DLM76_08650 [Leptospira yasudae]|uniref:LIC13197/LIC10919/LIC10469 family protein n=1 Tax=Leptospira yasudae TaxID=2202201 RepID=UPI000E59B0AB|nr:hypothetical protein DLM76_08650 [Leptospira yasudae]